MIKKVILGKKSFRVEKFEKEVSRQLSSLLFTTYNLEIVVSYVHASNDLRSARIHLYRPMQTERENEMLESGLRNLYLRSHTAEEWVKFFSIDNLKKCILQVLQFYNKDIAHNLSTKMRFRYIPELFFKYDETYYGGETIDVTEVEMEEVQN